MRWCYLLSVLVCLSTAWTGYSRRHHRRLRQPREVSPVIVTYPRSQTILTKGTIALACNATGSPRPKIVWYRENEKVSRNRYEINTRDYKEGSASVLWIENARKKKDAVRFSCVASNKVDTVQAEARITLIDENEKQSGFPHIDINPTVKTVEKTRAVSMMCAVSGTPTPTVRWYKDYMPLDVNGSRVTMGSSGTLHILKSNDTDQGKYHCAAENHYGVIYSAGAHIYVRVRRVPPKFSIPPHKDYSVQRNGDADITCVAVGSPMPVVKWQKETAEGPVDVFPLAGTDRVIGRVVLPLRNIQESANYTCVASSILKTIKVTTEIRVKALPKPPVNVRRSSSRNSAYSLGLSWQSGNSDPVTSYTIYYRKRDGTADAYNTTANISSTSFIVSGLKPFVEYELRVSAVNPQGEGNRSAAFYARTYEAAPSSSPRDITAYMYGTSTIMVMWAEPKRPNGIIINYKVYYTSQPILPYSEWRADVVSGEMLLTSLRNLVPAITYSIRVSALNSAGEGPLSQEVLVKTVQGVPPQPRNFRGQSIDAHRIRLNWDEPNWGENNGGYDITSYAICYNCSGPGCSKAKQITIQPSREFTLLNLEANMVYDVKVVAQTVIGKGAFTSPISVRTLSDAPSAPPQKVTVSAADERSIIVRWNPPPKENENGDLTGFTVYYRPSGIERDVSSVRTGPEINSTLIQGLKPFTSYGVWVSASTEVGESPNSPEMDATTMESKPGGAPQLMSLEAVNGTAFRVRWISLPPRLANGIIRGYQIAYAVSDVPNPRTRFVSAFEGKLSNKNRNQVLEYIVKDLQPKTRYSVFVSAFTSKGAGAPSDVQHVTTKGLAPGKPSLLVTKKEDGRAMLMWTPPSRKTSGLVGYVLQYRCDDCSALAVSWNVRRFNFDVRSFSPSADDGVIPGWTYTFKLAAANADETGPESTFRLHLPPIPPSDAPRELSGKTVRGAVKKLSSALISGSNYGIKLKWNPLPREESNGLVTGYTVYWRESTLLASSYENMTSTNPSCYFANVAVGEKYQFRVAARNKAGEGPKSPPVIVTVSEYRPTNTNITVSEFTVQEASSNTVWLRWIPPPDVTQARYVITYRSSNREKPMQREARSSHIAISGLNPSRGYNFTVTVHAVEDGVAMQLGTSSLLARTTPTLMTFAPIVQNIMENGSVIVVLTQAENVNNVKKYSVIVMPWDDINPPDADPDMYSQDEVLRNSITMRKRRRRQISSSRPYITAEFPTIPLQKWFSLGDGKNYGGYVNKPLQHGASYRVFLRAIQKNKVLSYTSTPLSPVIHVPELPSSSVAATSIAAGRDANTLAVAESNQLWIIAPVASVFLIIALVLVIICVRRKRSQEKMPVKYSAPVSKHTVTKNVDHDPVDLRRQVCQTQAMVNHPPIPVMEMEANIERLRANDNLKFSQQYESIDPGQQFMWEHSLLEVNKSKNRYANVVAYDHSRVTLSPMDGVPGSDYINANYISGYRRQNAYIATQGPTTETATDFWRMVWEQRSCVIVMMTKCEERCKVKCDQYWPIGGSETYGLMQVTLIDEMELATYCIRTLALFKNGSDERREIKHFQFTAWPDHGVPEHPTPVLNFMRRARSFCQSEAGPLVVHCSAGVGRSGCFICIDAMLERMKHENSVDVYGQVTCMRAERNYMVQTEDQYIFIHDALLEAINCGNTEIPARSLYSHLHKLTTPEVGGSVTGMELEFKRLANSKASASRFVSANLPCNKFKNRLVNLLPYEGSRVCLQPVRGVEGSDYINASFIDGYRQKQAYIATQGPLPETTDDFWRMLWEHNSTIVVMLTKLREIGRDKCHQYWPAERSARYQYFVVDPMSEYSMQQYTLREFKVTDARDGQSRTIRQFHFTDWPEQAVPKSGEGFIDFIGQVHKTKEQFGQEGPITIHCSAGVGRSGVFVTLSIALERMRFENVVDMFQTVKTLRTQRPAMVQTEDQYQFCYRAALEYLGSFDHYATA